MTGFVNVCSMPLVVVSGVLFWPMCAMAETRTGGSAACPPGYLQPPVALEAADLVAPESVKGAEAVGWQTLRMLADGKRTSLIQTRYRFSVSRVWPYQSVTLMLRFDQVSGNPALVYVYGQDGTALAAGSTPIFASLRPEALNEVTVRLRGPGSGGGVVVVTCQNGRASIYSISLPGRTQTRHSVPGKTTVDAEGNAIVRIPLKP